MRGRRKARQPDYHLEMAFELEVRRMPLARRRELLTWMRRWQRRPERVFWELTPTGEWRRL
jgi:hypothetical protein